MKPESVLATSIQTLDNKLTDWIQQRAEIQIELIAQMEKAAAVDTTIKGVRRALQILNEAANHE